MGGHKSCTELAVACFCLVTKRPVSLGCAQHVRQKGQPLFFELPRRQRLLQPVANPRHPKKARDTGKTPAGSVRRQALAAAIPFGASKRSGVKKTTGREMCRRNSLMLKR